MERNRRVVKAYVRSQLLTIHGGDQGFDGAKIGLSGFDNPYEDRDTRRVKASIGKVNEKKMFLSSSFDVMCRLF